MRYLATLTCLWLTNSPLRAQQPAQPNALHVVRVDGQNETSSVTIPGYHYLGSPCFSRDGEWIAFDAYKSNIGRVKSEVWISRRDGKELKMLAVGATPRWSPDGTRLVFMREQRNDAADETIGIFTVERNGEGERYIGPGRWPDWSPDGNRLAFSHGSPDTKSGGTLPLARIHVAKADGTEPVVIANGDCPSWSPDGLTLACCYRDPALPAPLIRLVDLKTGQQRFAGYGWYRANWQKDGRIVACNGIIEQRPAMITMALGGEAKAKSLFPEVSGAMSPCYSVDGKYLVFVAPHG